MISGLLFCLRFLTWDAFGTVWTASHFVVFHTSLSVSQKRDVIVFFRPIVLQSYLATELIWKINKNHFQILFPPTKRPFLFPSKPIAPSLLNTTYAESNVFVSWYLNELSKYNDRMFCLITLFSYVVFKSRLSVQGTASAWNVFLLPTFLKKEAYSPRLDYGAFKLSEKHASWQRHRKDQMYTNDSETITLHCRTNVISLTDMET